MPEREGGDGGDPELPGAPPKGTRPPGPPPGGGPGGPPPGSIGGGLAAFGRRSPLLRGFSQFPDATLPVLLRRRGLSRGAPPPASPGRGDTVPAMLQPGEKVIPQNVSQDPAYEPALDALIAQGRMGMGMAPGEAYGQGPIGMMGGGEVPDMDMPGQRPSRAIRILQLLLELDDMEPGMGMNGSGMGMQRFAFGGTAQSGGLFGQMQRRGGLGGFGAGGGIPNPAAPPSVPPDGYNRDTEGNVTNFDPKNPWGGYAGSQNAFGLGLLYRGIGQAGQAGAFDPRGNQALINSQIEAAQGTKDALVRRQMTAADLYGLDPAQQAVAKLQAQRDAGRGVQDISAQIRANAAQSADDFYKNLYNQSVGGSLGYTLNEQNARNQRIAQQNAQANANKNWWQPIVGAAVGGFTGGLTGGPAGAAAGARAGGGSVGRNQPVSTYEQVPWGAP